MQKLKNWLNGLSDVLPDLLIGILLYGVACEAVGLIFVKDRLFYSIGLLTWYFMCHGHGSPYGVVAEYGTGSGRKRCGEEDAAA